MRTNGILKHKISKLAEIIGLLCLKVLSLVLLTVYGTTIGKCELPPHKTVTSIPVSVHLYTIFC